MAWFLNLYKCDRCRRRWADEWSCMCDDECPRCGARNMTPYDSEDLTTLIEEEGSEYVVLWSPDVMGGPLSQGQFFTTTKFADANPKIIQAVRDATKEAQELIRNDPRTAVEIYKEVTGDKTPTDDVLAWLKEPGMMEWNLEPQGTMKFANHLFKTGTLKTQPKAWTDYYLPVAHDLKGN